MPRLQNLQAAALVAGRLLVSLGACTTSTAEQQAAAPAPVVIERPPTVAQRLPPSTMAKVGPVLCAVDGRGALRCTAERYAVDEPVSAVAISSWLAAVVTRSGDVLSWVAAADWTRAAPEGRMPPSHRLHVEGRRFVDVLVSTTEICAADDEGRIWCWNFARFEPEELNAPKRLASLAPCGDVFCGTLIDGQLVLVERDRLLGGQDYRVTAKPIQRALGFASGAYAIENADTGRRVGCGIRHDRVVCEGDRSTSFAERIAALGAGTRLFANQRLACVLTHARGVRCVTPEQDPFELACLRDAMDLTLEGDGSHVCARRADGSVRCVELRGDSCSDSSLQL